MGILSNSDLAIAQNSMVRMTLLSISMVRWGTFRATRTSSKASLRSRSSEDQPSSAIQPWRIFIPL